ncbi:DUF1045 domain-containing protein [Pseudogemmobacter sonorensis]|uniref:DUF1045 domain-containing protein n=1 Tax=Pseudogemmobacter sonorensis TaxID=2989681 RepID=UPI0036C0422F
MDQMKRFAVYYAPEKGAFEARASAWLGWDTGAGRPLAQPDLGLPGGTGAAEITRDPGRYGFHGTIRAPFRLAEGSTPAALKAALEDLARRLPPVTLPGLRLVALDGFLALIPEGDPAALQALAARVVEETNPFRAALTADETARRRPERLTPRQRALLDLWGYPFVMEEFRFHLTLTDRLDPAQADEVARILAAHFAPVLPRPFTIDSLCLFGEAEDGRFHLLHRFSLHG